jgi:hypothetical protein
MARYPVLESTATESHVCRCGTVIRPGERVFTVATLAPRAQVLFESEVFCSDECICAFCLESLETLDAIDTPASTGLVHDLRETRQGLAETFAAIRAALP